MTKSPQPATQPRQWRKSVKAPPVQLALVDEASEFRADMQAVKDYAAHKLESIDANIGVIEAVRDAAVAKAQEVAVAATRTLRAERRSVERKLAGAEAALVASEEEPAQSNVAPLRVAS